jgi:hypothetical protein
MDVTAKQLGEFLAYGTAVAYAFFKIFQNIFQFLKKVLNKESSSPKGGNVIVNVDKNDPAVTITSTVELSVLVSLLFEYSRVLESIHEMKSEILREQMSYFTKHSDAIKIKCHEVIADLLKQANIESIHFGTYFTNFENFIDVVDAKTTVTIRNMCKDNHFSQYSNIEFKSLVNKNITIIEGNIMELFRKRYPQREYIKDFGKIREITTMLRNSLQECFDKAREIAIEKEQQVESMKDAFECEVSKVIGKKFSC